MPVSKSRISFEFIHNYTLKGVTQLFCTDISKDGKLEGPSIELYKKIILYTIIISIIHLVS